MASNLPKRIHITGGPGSGKSWLAKRIAASMDVELIDLDGRMLRIKPLEIEISTPEELGAFIAARDVDLDEATQADAWVSEGAFVGVTQVAFERAGLIVWMDAPWRIASYRIVSRHAKLELRRRNRFPGWKRLYLFWKWSGRFYRDANPPGLNVWGTPGTRAYTREVLAPYESKLVIVRTKREVRELRAGSTERCVVEAGAASHSHPSPLPPAEEGTRLAESKNALMIHMQAKARVVW